MSPVLLLGAAALVALAASSKKSPKSPSCIDAWARYLVSQEPALLPSPEARELFADTLQSWGWAQSAACHRAAAGVMRSGGQPKSCLSAYQADLTALRDPEQLHNIAENARAAGMADVAACFDQRAASFGG